MRLVTLPRSTWAMYCANALTRTHTIQHMTFSKLFSKLLPEISWSVGFKATKRNTLFVLDEDWDGVRDPTEPKLACGFFWSARVSANLLWGWSCSPSVSQPGFCWQLYLLC